MNKAVLISIRPEWCEKIASGRKTIEVRKSRPKIETPFKCYIYCTQDNKNDLIIKNHKGYLFGKISDRAKSNLTESWIANGQVIGEFICRDIEPITPYGCLSTRYATPRTCKTDLIIKSGLYPESKLIDYLGYNKGFAWHISDLVIYDKPKELSEFAKPCYFKYDCGLCKAWDPLAQDCMKKHIKAPQSWCYVEES